MSTSTSIVKEAIEDLGERLTEYVNKQSELADEILQLKQRRALEKDDVPASHSAVGSMVAQAVEENFDLLQKTGKVRFDIKAATDLVTTSQGRTLVNGGVGAPSIGAVLGIQNGLRSTTAMGTTAVEYFRFTGTEGSAGVQAGEGAAKPAVKPSHTAVTQAALTIAAYTNMSKQAMSDSTELAQAVDITLRRSLAIALDSTLNAGNVTPAWTGLLALATNHTSTLYSTLWDAASEAAVAMLTGGFLPSILAISPDDWLAITVAKNPTTDDYYSGSYLGPLPETLRGMRIVLSPSMTAGKCMVIDDGQAELKIVESVGITVGHTGSQFTENEVTVLAEMRVIPVYRAVGAARLVTPAAP